jgi:hypothetical protein
MKKNSCLFAGIRSLKTQTLQTIFAAVRQITDQTKATRASGINALHAMIANCPAVAAETAIDVGGSVFNGATSRAALTLQELKTMCEQFKDQIGKIGKSDAAFNEFIPALQFFHTSQPP